MTDQRERLLDKIKKLKTKGTDAGVTEEEANAFLDAAARLMREHGIDDTDVERAGIDVVKIDKKGAAFNASIAHPAAFACASISALTGTSIGMGTRYEWDQKALKERHIGTLIIAGRPPDREIADYLFDQVRNLIDGAWAQERKRRISVASGYGFTAGEISNVIADEKGFGIGHKARRSFGIGMAVRIAQRLEAMAARKADCEAAQAVWEANVEAKKDKSKLDVEMHAFMSGRKSGDRVDLGQGVATGTAAPLAIAKEPA